MQSLHRSANLSSIKPRDQQELDVLDTANLSVRRRHAHQARKFQAEALVDNRVIETLDWSLDDVRAGRSPARNSNTIAIDDHRKLVLRACKRQADRPVLINQKRVFVKFTQRLRELHVIEPSWL